ncbi:MAG TPA: ABC transporter ATP-binding protein [Planctomycetota bacterium]|jgi:ABC-type multidrug transport system fused ATPase/permease subunit
MNAFWRVLKLLRPHLGAILCGLFFLVLSTSAMLIQPVLWQQMVDKVLIARQTQLFWPLIAGMLAAGLVGSVASGMRTWLIERVGQKFVLELRTCIYAHLQNQPLSFFHDRRTGDLLARVIGDVDTLQEVVINGTDQFLSNLLGMLGVAAVMIWYKWDLGLLTVAPVMFTFLLMYRYNMRVKPIYRAARDRLGDVSAKLAENLTGVQTIKAFAREDHAAEKLHETISMYFVQNLLGISLRVRYMPAVQFISFIGSIIMIGYGGYQILLGTMSLGVLLAYRGYWWHLYGPVYSIAGINDLLQRASAAGGRIFDLLDHQPELRDAENARELPKIEGRVSFENVAFGYPSRPQVITGLDLSVAPGTRVGLVGSSGAGKSTLLGLIPRFYDPLAGQIRIDGVDVRTITQHSLRRQIGMVLQESFLFNDSVLTNIRFGRPGASREDVQRAAADANAHDFIAQLPQGYDTVVGERGVKLSGGQRQRIAIARAFLADPAILLLDEATSAVEPESEAIIQQALERLMSGRTSFIVSHRLSVIRPCDVIVVIEGGKLAEQGTHAQLLQRGGIYAQMYRMQMGEEAHVISAPEI